MAADPADESSRTRGRRSPLSALRDRAEQERVARDHLQSMVADSLAEGDLGAADVEELRSIDPTEVREYLCGLGVHLIFKMILPPGVTGVTSISTAVALHSLWPLLGIFIGPALRTSYTLLRVLVDRRHDHRIALLVGTLPLFGILAYPAQMQHTCPQVWRLMWRRTLRRLHLRPRRAPAQLIEPEHAGLLAAAGTHASRIARGFRVMSQIPGQRHHTFLSQIVTFEHEGAHYYLKGYTRWGGLLYNLRIVGLWALGDRGIRFAPASVRHARERSMLARLRAHDVPAVELAPAQPPDAVLMRKLEGTCGRVLLMDPAQSAPDKLELVRRAASSLRQLHAVGIHGDAQAKNVILTPDGQAAWLDLDYVPRPQPGFRQQGRDLLLLVFSATRYSGLPAGEVVAAGIGGYGDDRVTVACWGQVPIRREGYQLFCHWTPAWQTREINRALRREWLAAERRLRSTRWRQE